MYYTPVRVLKF